MLINNNTWLLTKPCARNSNTKKKKKTIIKSNDPNQIKKTNSKDSYMKQTFLPISHHSIYK